MRTEDAYRWRRQLVIGLLLVALGLAVLLDQLDIMPLDAYWRYWPLVLVVIGIGRTVGAPDASDFVGGVWMALFGAWLFASLEHLFRLTLWNSWPVLIIITGVAVALRPFAERRFGPDRPRHPDRPSDQSGR